MHDSQRRCDQVCTMDLTHVDKSNPGTGNLTIAWTQPHFFGDKTSLLCT